MRTTFISRISLSYGVLCDFLPRVHTSLSQVHALNTEYSTWYQCHRGDWSDNEFISLDKKITLSVPVRVFRLLTRAVP
jgi:hypothetical protein